MKKKLPLLMLMCLTVKAVYGQFVYEPADEGLRRISYGLDIVKSSFSAINLHDYPLKSQRFLAIEPAVRIQRIKPNCFWLIQPGVTHITGMPFNVTRLNMTGGFLKFGPEWQSGPEVCYALLATSSVWQTSGVVQTTATAFSPYAGAIPIGSGVAFGTEFQWNINTHLGPQWIVRLNLRTNLFWKSDAGKAIETPYIPGVGLFIDSVSLSPLGSPPLAYHPVGFTVGATAQVFYAPNRHL